MSKSIVVGPVRAGKRNMKGTGLYTNCDWPAPGQCRYLHVETDEETFMVLDPAQQVEIDTEVNFVSVYKRGCTILVIEGDENRILDIVDGHVQPPEGTPVHLEVPGLGPVTIVVRKDD